MKNDHFVRKWAWLGGLFPLGNLLLLAGNLGLDIVIPVQLAFISFPIISNIMLIAAGAALKHRGLRGWAIAGMCLSILLVVLGITSTSDLVGRGSLSLLNPMLFGSVLLIVDSVAIGFFARRTGNNLLYITAIAFALLGLSRVGELILWVHVAATVLYIAMILQSGRAADFKPRVLSRRARLTVGTITFAGLAIIALVPYLIINSTGDQTHPKFITADFVELSKISNVSRFRSHAGHEYVDSFEGGERSMKHYFNPDTPYRNSSTSIAVYAPAHVFVSNIAWEGHEMYPGQLRGFHVDLVPLAAPLYKITIFHVNVTGGVFVGAYLSPGELLGYADTRNASDFDIAINLQMPFNIDRHVSYFAVMDDAVFSVYQSRGIANRGEMIISRVDADAAEGMNMPQSWDWVDLT